MPKIDSLVHAFDSLELNVACITETWFKPGRDLQERMGDLEGEHGIRVVHRSRDGRLRRAAGGVAIAFKVGSCNLRKRDLRNRKDGQEIVCVTGKIGKIPRKVAILAVYVPPDTRAQQFKDLCDTLVQEIAELKTSLGDPIIYVTGDFNHRDVGPSLELAAGLKLVITPPTRGDNCLDRVYTNTINECEDAMVLPPLDAPSGASSDHKCVHVRGVFPALRNFTWVAKLRRTRTKAADDAFAAELQGWDWSELERAESVDLMADELENAIAALTEKHFPLVRVRRRSNEDPWITRRIRRLWKRKIRLYKKNGKSQAWWDTDLTLQREIASSKEAFVERMLEDGNNGRPFYAATKKLAAASPIQPWKVGDLFVGMGPGEVCKEVLDFYGKLAKSETFGPSAMAVPRVRGGLGTFTIDRTVELLRGSKRTESRVDGDPQAHLIRTHAECFARPVAEIFNRINDTGRWPRKWKTEHLTVIPKKPNPTDLSECRNISCTSAFSKILEGQVLLQLRGELDPDDCQYGGIPKCGVEHMLLDLWENILSGIEGGKNAAVILGVDYEKAFNRMEHDVCIEQLRRLGASDGSLSLVAAFLEDRSMKITIDGHSSKPVPIQRGSPQGSVLGCLLYCATTQGLTKDLRAARPGTESATQSPDRRPDTYMYVDDTTLVDVVPMDDAVLHFTTAQTAAHLEGLELERDLETLKDRAEDINMKINVKKTQLLVISPPNGWKVTASIDSNPEVIQAVDKLKLVGFTFGTDPGAGAHVEAVKDRIKRKVWMLYKLRSAGFRGVPLFKLYCCYLRTIIEYCSVVYHSLLTKGQAWVLERLQRLAVRICFGGHQDTDAVMEENLIQPLEARRTRRCDAFLRKAARCPRFGNKWFPPRRGIVRDLRRRRSIEETRAATARRFNSPLAFLRRRANQIGIAVGP